MANISPHESGTNAETDSPQEHNNEKTQTPKREAADVVKGLC